VRIGKSLSEAIGNAPMLTINRLARCVAPVRILAKAEWLNPTGSIKDRSALAIIRDAEHRGGLDRNRTLIDATSGNADIVVTIFADSAERYLILPMWARLCGQHAH